MIGFARFTAIVFMILGIILIIAGAVLAFGGILRLPAQSTSVPGLMPDLSGLSLLAGAVAGGVLAFQGLLLAAVGQGLWLMASMTYKTQLSIEYLAELVNRMGNANR